MRCHDATINRTFFAHNATPRMPLDTPGNVDDDNDEGSVVGAAGAGTKFVAQEDFFIARAWIKSTTDPKFGTAQKGHTFYQTLFNHYTKWIGFSNLQKQDGESLIPEGHSLNAIKQRWFMLQRGVNYILAVRYRYPPKSGEDHATWQARLELLYLAEFKKVPTQKVPDYCLPSFNSCAKFLKDEPKFMCSGRASNATNYTTVAAAASRRYDDSSSAASEHESENEKDGGDISENDQYKKRRANKSVATAGHARRPQGKHQVANAKLISQSSKEALDIMGLNNQQSINAQSFLDNLTSAMNRTTDMMAFALAMQTLPDGEMKNMVAKQMLAGTGILTRLGDRCHTSADNRNDMPGGNYLNTFGSDYSDLPGGNHFDMAGGNCFVTPSHGNCYDMSGEDHFVTPGRRNQFATTGGDHCDGNGGSQFDSTGGDHFDSAGGNTEVVDDYSCAKGSVRPSPPKT